MTAAAILAIVVATSEINDPATAIMIGAAGESLGPGVAIRLLGANQPDDADLLRIERETGAGAVVTLVWRDASRLHARIRLHVAASGHTTTRELAFSDADTRVERGRTLGLAAASMWPEIRAPAAEVVRPSIPPAASAARAPVRAPRGGATSVPAPRVIRPNAEVTPPATVPGEVVREAAPAPDRPRFALGLAGVGATGDARALGARIESVFGVARSCSLTAGLSARTGPIPVLAGGTVWTLALAAGVEWWPPALHAAALARFGIRADAIGLRHQVSGAAVPGQTETRARFVPAFDLMAQTAIRASARVDLLASAGGELALGDTDVRTGSPPLVVAKIPAFQLVAQVGIRVGF